MTAWRRFAFIHSKFWVWFIVSGLALLNGCSPIYTPPLGWAIGIDQTQYPVRADMEKATTQAFRERFRPDLSNCVSENDPQHLYEMDNGGEYRISGWFVSNERTAPVQDCMRRKGWQPYPLWPIASPPSLQSPLHT
jgi:hypothetical protein